MMSDYSFELDGGYDIEDEEMDYPAPRPGPVFNRRFVNRGYNMDDQYNEAFGDYRGGYGPGNGYGPNPPRPRPYPPGPFFRGRGRGYGYMGPPIRREPMRHPALKMLSDCGVVKQNMKNLPVPLLNMINPDYCGLCAQEFESFAIAKIHYNCKNHLKAQKKFISQTADGFSSSEVPIKARNLYCELCDVHITSTSHAASHYAGKAHRAVVEGRKPPKNPILLQPGMEGRVEQLIRRERKAFKSAPTAAGASDASSADKPLQEAVPPELICEICKTTVTNTEQMTMHLNGKRHLSREKQHILMMMKGDSVKEEQEEEGEGEDNGDEEGMAVEAGEGEQAAAVAAPETDTVEEDTVEEDTVEEDTVEEWGTGANAAETWDENNEEH